MFRVRSLIRRLFSGPDRGQAQESQMMPSPTGGMPQVMPTPPAQPKPDLSKIEAAMKAQPRREQEERALEI